MLFCWYAVAAALKISGHFNDEQLAYAIAQSPIPVVSGVGHETDFTIADFVSDLRAPTPTGAAELAAPRKDQMLQELDAIMQALLQRINQRVEREAQTLDQLALRLSPRTAQSRSHARANTRMATTPQSSLVSAYRKLENAIKRTINLS